MTTEPKVPVTQRAYTLRLRGVDPNDESWRDALWATHEAVNKGAKAFGDWLLTLRGGLDHSLDTLPPVTDQEIDKEWSKRRKKWTEAQRSKKSNKSDKPEPTRDEVRDHLVNRRAEDNSSTNRAKRRTVLALGWLSVEDAEHAPSHFCVAYGSEARSARCDKVVTALGDILGKRGVVPDKIKDWLRDCGPSLSSKVREDGVWVDRSAAFDAASDLPGRTREHTRQVLEYFVGNMPGFLSLPAGEESNSSGQAEKEDDSKDFVEKAHGWLSFNCGKDEKSDKKKIATNLTRIADTPLDDLAGRPGRELLTRFLSLFETGDKGDRASKLKAIRDRVGWLPGPASKGLKAIQDRSEKARLAMEDITRLREKLREEAQERLGQIDEFAVPWASNLRSQMEAEVRFEYAKTRFGVMLDHALRRFSSTHTWMKRAEAKRRKFDQDAGRINEMKKHYAHAVAWLDEFCRRQSERLGSSADGGYRIRKRALGGKTAKAWKAVLQAWSRADCSTEQDRIDVVGELQSQWEEDEKFGYPDLFNELAGDDALCVWWQDGGANPQILIDYVVARTAEFDRTRYKVPMYRHPDLLKHPVFCDFGDSRWSVDYEARKAPRQANHVSNRRKNRKTDVHAVTLQVLANAKVDSREFRWASKRLDRDLGIVNGIADREAIFVTRADRLGRALQDASGDVEVLNVFNESHWNARLQAPRGDLEQMARHIKKGDLEKAESVKRRLHWFLTFSPRLQPKGPWIEFACKQEIYPAEKEIQLGPKKERDEWRGLAYPIWHTSNEKGRTGFGKHILSRYPGLRILSVDLGHRFAAACAVWETLTGEQFKKEIGAARANEDQGWAVEQTDLYTWVRKPEQESNRSTKKAKAENRVKRFRPTTVYRRIGLDTLDGKPHPAPWARLERQFLIKLQGEERPARKAWEEEIWGVHELERRLGSALPLIDRLVCGGWPKTEKQRRLLEAFQQKGWTPVSHQVPTRDNGDSVYCRQPSGAVDELMFWAVRNVRLALRRHARRAKIARALDPATRSVFGTGGKEMAFKAGDEIHVKLLSDALFDWHALASETRWGDRAARRLWNDHIGAIEPDLRIAEPERDPGALEERTAQQRRKSDQALRARLEPVAERLTGEDHSAIYSMWRKRWDEDDGHAAADIEHTVTTDATGRNCSSSTPGTAATGWHADLRWLTDWIMGWHLPGASSKMWTRNVGGLSVTRIATMRSLYQLHKAFAMRPTPGKPRGAPEKGESNAGVAQRILDAMERMRGQRVKQLASRIAASALGLGGYWKKVQVPRRDAAAKFIRQPDGSFETKEHLVWVEKASPKYVPCHAIVIEDLTNYRPDELQTRRENRQLMNWSSSKVKKYLAEACQLHGLHLRQVSAAWTSRQDSRTGMPGVRCEDVPEEVFRTAPRWRKQVRQANKKSLPQRTERDKYLLALEEKWRSASHKKRHGAAVRIPSRGGDIFVSAADGQTASSGIQADLNAAANIGLKALLDPDWPGRWWYVPCSTSDGRPAKDRVGGCPIIQMDKTLRRACDVASTPPAPGGAAKGSSTGGKKGTSKRSGRQGEIVNLWRDPSMEDILPGSKWHPTKDYWKVVERRVIARLRELAGLGKTLDTATPW